MAARAEMPSQPHQRRSPGQVRRLSVDVAAIEAGRLGRPVSDLPRHLGETERRAWRAGWLLGQEEARAWHAQWEAGVLAYGLGAPRRAA